MNQKTLRISRITAALLTIGMLASCSVYHVANHAIDTTKHQIQDLKIQSRTTAPTVMMKPGFYFDTKPMSLTKPAPWLSRHIVLQTEGLPFYMLVSRITRNSPAVNTYHPGINKSKPVTMNYKGTVQGALEKLATQSDYAFTMNKNHVDWSSFVTKTFNISFMPGSSSYLVGQSQAGDDTETGGPVSSATIATVGGHLEGSQYSNLQAKLSVWVDLKKTLDELKSPDGKVYVSESTTEATVRDHPSNVRAMAKYITELNHEMSKEVSLQVQVLEIELDKQFTYGVDWNLVQQICGTAFKLTSSVGTAANLTSSAIAGIATSGLTELQVGSNVGSHAIIHALERQGKLRVVTQPTVVTMNNQMAEIRITRDTGYLQSISTTTVVNGPTTTALNPGNITDGFSLYLLPKILLNKVYLQISSSISNLTALQKVDNCPSGSADCEGSEQNNFQAIQVPSMTEKHFNQRTVVTSGTTVIITGFKQLRSQTRVTKMFGSQLLGGTGADDRNIQTIVLITPIILKNA